MFDLKFRFVKARMNAYVNGELSPPLRRYIARQIDQDMRCYREYRRHRTIKENFEHQLAFIPKPTHERVDAMWTNIQHGLTSPAPHHLAPNLFSIVTCGVATFLLVMVFIIPLNWRSLGRSLESSILVPSQPAPHQIALMATPTARASGITIHITQTEDANLPGRINQLANTPNADLPQS